MDSDGCKVNYMVLRSVWFKKQTEQTSLESWTCSSICFQKLIIFLLAFMEIDLISTTELIYNSITTGIIYKDQTNPSVVRHLICKSHTSESIAKTIFNHFLFGKKEKQFKYTNKLSQAKIRFINRTSSSVGSQPSFIRQT